MKCHICNAQLEEKEEFCSNCGATVSPNEEKMSSKIEKNTLLLKAVENLKTFFSSNMEHGILQATEEKNYVGLIFAGLYILLFSLSMPLLLYNLLSFKIVSYQFSISYFVGYGELFGVSILIGILSYAVLFASSLIFQKIYQSEQNIVFSSINTIGYTLIPAIVATAANLLLSVIWAPLAILALVFAVILQILLLYRATQKSEKASALFFAVFATLCLGIILAVIFKGYSWIIADSVSKIFSKIF